MFNTFTDTCNTEENNTKQMNGLNPFDLPSSTADPFGISSNMKLSESSEKFDDNPFIVDTNKEKGTRPRSGKEALSSSNWLAYQHSMDEANFDLLEDARDKSLITQSNNDNPMNPFSAPTVSSNTDQSNEILLQISSMNLLFDSNIDSNTTLPTNSNNLFTNFDECTSTNIVTGNAFSTDWVHHSTTTNTETTNLFPSQPATMTGIRSTSTNNDPFLDCFLQPNNKLLEVNPESDDANHFKENIFSKRSPIHRAYHKAFVLFLIKIFLYFRRKHTRKHSVTNIEF